MIRYFLFLLLLMPMTQAVAVTPTVLDFGEVMRGETVTREMLVVNTLEEKTNFEVDGAYKEEFELETGEKRLLLIPLTVIDKEDGEYLEYIVVREDTKDNLVNAVSIPVVYRVTGGEFTNADLNLDGVKSKKLNFKTKDIISVVLCVVVAGIAFIMLQRKDQKTSQPLNK